MRAASPPCASRCRRASNTSAARRPPATSAPRRCCSRTWRRMYAVYHGPEGLEEDRASAFIALTDVLAAAVSSSSGFDVAISDAFFDTLHVDLGDQAARRTFIKLAEAHRINLRVIDDADDRHLARRNDQRDDVADAACKSSTASKTADFTSTDLTGTLRSRTSHAPFARTIAIPHAPRLQPLPLRDRDAPLHQAARIARSLAHRFDDPARLLHDEAQRHGGNVPRVLAGVRARFIRSRPIEQTRGYQKLFRAARRLARGNHRLRRHFASAQRRFAGRIRRAARHSRLSRIARRGASQRLPHPHLRARHESRQRRHGRHESRRRRLRHERQHRRRRSARQSRGAQDTISRA